MDEQGVELVGTVRLLVFEGLTDGLRDFGEFQSCLIGKLSNFWVYDLAFGSLCVPTILLVLGVGKLHASSYLYFMHLNKNRNYFIFCIKLMLH